MPPSNQPRPVIDIRQSITFDRIFKEYYSALCLYASRILESYADAEDVVEELFVKLWDRKEQFESETHLKAFLYRSTKNACLDHLKVSQRSGQRNLNYTERFSTTQESFLHEVIKTEVMREIYLAVKNLPPQCGKIISMSYLEGLSNQEIADALGLSVQTIKNQKLRGLALLRQRLPSEKFALLLASPYLHLFDLITRN